MTFFGKKNTFGDPKPEKKEKVLKKWVYKPKATGERELFLSIWEERPHFCQVCGVGISNASPEIFAHILSKAKNKYPEFKLNKQNIVIMCDYTGNRCHFIWDFQRHKAIKDAQFKWLIELEESLKEQYTLLHGTK